MSSVNINNEENVSSNETVQSQQTTHSVTIHPPQSQSTQSSENYFQYPMTPSVYYHTNEIMPGTLVHDARNDHHHYVENIFDVHEYTVWSVFNLIFCCLLMGAFALGMSCKTRRKKKDGDLLDARSASKLAVVLNVLATLSGIVTITLSIFRFTGHISM
ncbi:unnamed protein product [Rotaria sp. Silwood1]|nr:unnamed protein product [Rotaria sp. Silwood1]